MPKKIKKKVVKPQAGAGTAVDVAGSRPQALSLETEGGILSGLFQAGRFAEAEAHARRVLEEQPGWIYGWNILGACCGKQNRNEEAVEAFRRVVHAAPEDPAMQRNLGMALKASGRYEEALAVYQRALKLLPGDTVPLALKLKADCADAMNSLANQLKDHGRLSEALELYQAALGLKPDYAEAYYNLGIALQVQGRLPEAVASYQEALQLKPGLSEAHYNLGIAYQGQDRSPEAIESFRNALRLNPSLERASLNLGDELAQQGSCREAAEHYRNALKLGPDNPETYNRLGSLLQKEELYAEAEERFRQALALKPDYAEACCNLGSVLLAENRLTEADENLRKALALKPDYAEAYNSLGAVLLAQGRLEEAVESLERAKTLNPDYASAYNNMGAVYMQMGKLQEAQEHYERAIQLKPEYVITYLNYSTSRKFTSDDMPLAGKLEKLLAEVGTDEKKSSLHFALGKIYSDCGMYDEAFLHYHAGNETDRKKSSYDRQKYSQTIDRVKEIFSPEFMKAKSGEGSSSELPVFILGMPRSGTTLIEQIVSSHPLVFGAGELSYVADRVRDLAAEQKQPWPDCATALTSELLGSVAADYLRYLRGFSESALRVTDKMPGNYLYLGLIAILFPKARVVHCRRSPEDTCLSIYSQKFKEGHAYSLDLEDLGYRYRDYERLMEHWRSVLPPGLMLEMQYEEVVERPEEMSRRLIGFCGLEWDDRCLEFYRNERTVRTASFWQVRQPIYKTSREKWRRYEKHLTPLLRALAGAAERPEG